MWCAEVRIANLLLKLSKCCSSRLNFQSSSFSIRVDKSKLLNAVKSSDVNCFNRLFANVAVTDHEPLRSSLEPCPEPEFSYAVTAYATAVHYNISGLAALLSSQKHGWYVPQMQDTLPNVCHAYSFNETEPSSKYGSESGKCEAFFFHEGSVVLWNASQALTFRVLQLLKDFETESYERSLVLAESEVLNYRYLNESKNTYLHRNTGEIILSHNPMQSFEKYAFSNAMALTVKLGIWETFLDQYIDSIRTITEDLKRGSKIKMSRACVLRKQGELFSLRRAINLSSDLLDTPDFYWDRDQLEKLYVQTCLYYMIPKRAKIMNHKLNECSELLSLVSSQLNDEHHIRLEWMIIILITVEVVFELVHCLERYSEKAEKKITVLLLP